MGATYTRQSSTEIVDGEVINAADFNNEFAQLVSAFAVSTGHTHDGTTAEGGPVTKLLGTAITVGDGTAGTDIAVTFDGETSDGVLTWMEDEDHFKFSDDVVIDSSKRVYLYDEGGEYIYGDGTDLYLVSGADINVPANIGVTFGNDGEKIEGDGTDLTISGNNINLTATADVNIPSGVGVTFATTEKIESDGTDLSITVGSGGDVNIPADIGVTFGNDGEKIEGNGTDLTITGNNINLTATADVVIPADVGITFGSGEKIEGDSTDLTVTSGADINLTATSDVNIPANVGVTFGNDGEKIEGDGTDLTISGNNINLTATADVVIPADVGITFGSGEKIEGNSTDLTVTSGADINLTATSDVNIPSGVGVTFGDDGEKIEGDGTDLTIASSNILTLDAGADVIVDAGGADITLKDDGTTYGSLSQSGGELVIKSGSTPTTALTFSGANATFAGTVTIGSAGISEAELEILDGASVTTTELNLIDGDTARGTTAVASGDGILINDAGTMRMTNVDTVSTYFSSHNVGGSNIVTTGALNSGSITSGFGTIDTGSSTITTTGLISGGSLDIDNVLINGTTIGHTDDTDLMTVADGVLTIAGELDATTLDISGNADIDGTTNLDAVDIDGAVQIDSTVTVGVDDTGHDVKFFGASAGSYMEWDESADQLRIMGASADATTSTGKLLLATSLTDINANDVIGKIDFQAPHEAGGTDAITVAASIQALAQATFSSSVNATDLIFYTGHSEAATEKFRFTSQGEIGIGGANYGTDGQVLTSGGAGAAPAWEDAGGGAVTALNNATANELVTVGSTTTELDAETTLTYDGSTLAVTGDVDITSGSILFKTASEGIYLGVTSQTAANLLDDYEEGTYTATVTTTTSGGFNLGNDLLSYTKIGNLVTVRGRISISSDNSPSGVIIVSLPFTPATPAEAADLYYNNGIVFDNHASSGPDHIIGLINGGEAFITCYQMTDEGAVGGLDQDDVDTAFAISVMIQFIS